MSKKYFTDEQSKICDLALDLARNNYSVNSDKITKKDLENHLRNKIKNDMLGGLSLYQAFRRNNLVIFEVIEEIVDISIHEEVLVSPFIENFVEYKNRKLGDDTAFYAEGGLLAVSTFAGNHWDTNRQALNIGDEIVLPKEWVYIHLYEELERFLLGITSLEKMLDKIHKSMNKFIQDRLYMQFQSLVTAVNPALTATGNSEEAVGKLVDTVKALGGFSNVTIAGTSSALRKLAGYIPDKMFANTQKEAKANTGDIGLWEGNRLMVIPQTIKPGTTKDLALDNTKLFIMGGDEKPIKFEFIGDTRSLMDTEGKSLNDMSIDMQVQTKVGMGLVVPQYLGVFTLS